MISFFDSWAHGICIQHSFCSDNCSSSPISCIVFASPLWPSSTWQLNALSWSIRHGVVTELPDGRISLRRSKPITSQERRRENSTRTHTHQVKAFAETHKALLLKLSGQSQWIALIALSHEASTWIIAATKRSICELKRARDYAGDRA